MQARFIMCDQAIINIDDISTVVPVWLSNPPQDDNKPDAIKVTFMSKATSITIENANIEDFGKQLVVAQQLS